MQLIHIMPVNNLEDMKQQPMQMFLTHLVLSNEKYRKFAQEYSGYKILDNSIIEMGEAASIEKVLEAAEMIEADEIILPDVFQNCDATLDTVRASWEYLRRNNITKYKLMAVAQGKTIDDWEYCFTVLNTMYGIDVIGIPKILATMHPCGRPFFEQFWATSKKEIHLLGLYYSFTELAGYKHLENIRSCDTCQFAFIAKNQLGYLSVRPDGFTVDLEKDSFEFSTKHREQVKHLNYLVHGLERIL